MKRNYTYLYVSYDIAKRAISDKKILDALAFAVSIKINYRNSIVYNKPIREMKRVFHIGQDKLCRVIKDAEGIGFVTRDNGNITASRLRNTNGLNIRLCFSRENNIKLNIIKDCIRKQILMNHFAVISKFRNTEKELLKSRDDEAYVNATVYRNARRFAKKCMNREELGKIEDTASAIPAFTIGVSKRSIARKMNCSISKAHRVVREMIEEGKISVIQNIVRLCDYDGIFNQAKFNEYNDTELSCCHIRRLAGHTGLYIQSSNTYLPKEKTIFFCAK